MSKLAYMLQQRDALLGFKRFVHRRLDEAGVPTHPDGPHSKEGCRIGDRLDLVLAQYVEPNEFYKRHVRLARIAEIIEQVDVRAMASDGPVSPTMQVMTQDEISAIYALAKGHEESWRP